MKNARELLVEVREVLGAGSATRDAQRELATSTPDNRYTDTAIEMAINRAARVLYDELCYVNSDWFSAVESFTYPASTEYLDFDDGTSGLTMIPVAVSLVEDFTNGVDGVYELQREQWSHVREYSSIGVRGYAMDGTRFALRPRPSAARTIRITYIGQLRDLDVRDEARARVPLPGKLLPFWTWWVYESVLQAQAKFGVAVPALSVERDRAKAAALMRASVRNLDTGERVKDTRQIDYW